MFDETSGPPLSDKQLQALTPLQEKYFRFKPRDGESHVCAVRLLDHRQLEGVGVEYPPHNLLVTGMVVVRLNRADERVFRWDFWIDSDGPHFTLYRPVASTIDPPVINVATAVVGTYLERFWSSHIVPLLN